MLLLPLRGHPMAATLSVLLVATLLIDVTRAAGRTSSTTTLSPEAQAELIKAIEEIFTPTYEESTSSSHQEQQIGPIDVPNYNTSPESKNPKDCACVAYYLCQNDTIVTNGEGLIDIRIQEDSPCKESFEKCCNKLKDPAPPTDKIKPNDPVKTYDENKIPPCGHWNPSGYGFRIVGSGNEAQFGEFPWMVAILKKNEINGRNLCGASLIHPKVALTAIHCLQDKKAHDLVVRAGEWDTATTNEQYKHQDREAIKIIKHERYYGGTIFNDVALVVVSEPFKLIDNVGTVCLPPQGYKFPSTPRCHASGWGKDTFGKTGVYQNILKRIDLPIVQHDECLRLLRETRLGNQFHLHESFICAGGEIGKDTCKGDGGSPMVCPIEGTERLQQAGIVAWGIGCGDKTPGVYVNVARFRLWIDHQILQLQLDPNYYDANYNPLNTTP